MSTYRLKSVARRSTFFGAALAVFAATIVPAAPAFADALNPLTERSLLLSSSAPGFQDTDGSGNSTDSPNAIGESYAPAGSGPNGKKSGQTFSFNVSTDSVATDTPIKAFTFQYCTTAAGLCKAPGNNTGDKRSTNRELNAVAHENGRSDLEVVTDGTTPWSEGSGAGQYEVLVEGQASSGWVMTTSTVEDNGYNEGVAGDGLTGLTGTMNYITLTNAGAGASPEFNDNIQVIFHPSETNYITNPGTGAFFVKINTYDNATSQVNPLNDPTPLTDTDQTVIDGGVTVANVMTDSIHITTKVLETMQFSVGIENRDEQVLGGANTHGSCDAMQVTNNNRLNLGNNNAEFSLETERAWDVHSYWRLSSNSSGGATVYYSGDTLRNTVGDFIVPSDTTGETSNPGSEQFGLAFVEDSELVSALSSSFTTQMGTDTELKNPSINPLTRAAAYANGSGEIGTTEGSVPDAVFAFDANSQAVPAQIASNTTAGGVLSCATAKMRYVGNIAADTPAGVYTTKINYLAAPQY